MVEQVVQLLRGFQLTHVKAPVADTLGCKLEPHAHITAQQVHAIHAVGQKPNISMHSLTACTLLRRVLNV